MSNQVNKPPMTKWDKQVVARLSEIIELDKAGKLEHLPAEQFFSEAREKIAAAQAEQRAKKIKTYRSYPAYAV